MNVVRVLSIVLASIYTVWFAGIFIGASINMTWPRMGTGALGALAVGVALILLIRWKPKQ